MAHLESYRSLYFWGVGKMVQAISTGRSALKHARHLRDRDLEIHVSSRLGAALIDRGDFESACKMLRTAIELIPTDAHHRRYGLLNVASVSNRAALARSLSEIGAFREAVQVGDEAVQIADEVGHPFSQVYANLSMGNTLIKSADYARAIPPLERCVHMTESPGLNLLRPRSMSSLGYAYFSSGQQEKGLALLQQAVDEAERDSIVWNIAQQYAWLAEALMQTGDLEAAFKVATKALEVSVNSGEKASEAGALWLLGEVHRRRDATPAPLAHRYLTKAWDIANAHRMRPLQGHCHRSLADYFMTLKAPKKAEGELEKARSVFANCDMPRFLELVGHDARLFETADGLRIH